MVSVITSRPPKYIWQRVRETGFAITAAISIFLLGRNAIDARYRVKHKINASKATTSLSHNNTTIINTKKTFPLSAPRHPKMRLLPHILRQKCPIVLVQLPTINWVPRRMVPSSRAWARWSKGTIWVLSLLRKYYMLICRVEEEGCSKMRACGPTLI